jgi:hypothetical protein
LLEISCTSSYKIPRASMKPLSKSASNLHGRCLTSKILYFRFYRIIHFCFCDFQSIDGLDFKVHACMSTIITCRGLQASEPWGDSVRYWDSGIRVYWINHICISFNLDKHSKPTPFFFSYVASYGFLINMT